MKVRIALIMLILLTGTLMAQRTRLKPKTNIDPKEDVKLGREAAAEAEKQLTLLNNRDVVTYVNSLGQRIASKADNPYKFNFTFKVVDEKEINAFALPGGPMYVNRGALEAADNEAQIAGVMGHEMGHVLLRHGIAQAEKGQKIGLLAGIVGAVAGNGTLGQVIGAGSAFGANMALMRYSRDAESEADLIGTQLLFDNGYDSHAMSDFFEKLAQKHKGSKAEQWFSDHPIPENRVAKVNAEIARLGTPAQTPRSDSAEFQRIKKMLLAMPAPKATRGANGNQTPSNTKRAAPALPSTRFTDLRIGGLQLRHPDNWKPLVNGNHVTLAPANGTSESGDLAYGMLIDVMPVQNVRSLEQATTQLLDGLKQGNPAMTVGARTQARIDGVPALATQLSNDSPFGGKEVDSVVTLLRSSNELLYFVAVAPEKDFAQYRQAFQSLLESVRLGN